MLSFSYIAYSAMALLLETVQAFEDTWIECLGDLGGTVGREGPRSRLGHHHSSSLFQDVLYPQDDSFLALSDALRKKETGTAELLSSPSAYM
jgi:hypothetical protein